jgi:predicted lipid-binding transport protein (Tim44 family)
MKISWTSLKVSIAGAKLSHLVQEDKIWDHGSMTEQARIAFHVVIKATNSANSDLLKKYCTVSCLQKFKAAMNDKKRKQDFLKASPVIKELAVISVHKGKHNRPDMFTALIKGEAKNDSITGYYKKRFSIQWSFVRQGDWWILNAMED